MKITLALVLLQIVCPFTFAPQEGLVKDVEKPFREEICINGLWDFQSVAVPDSFIQGSGEAPVLTPPSDDGWDDVRIRIPSPWNANGYCDTPDGPDHKCFPSYPAEWKSVRMAWMRKKVHIPSDWKDRSVRLHFEAVAGRSVVIVNGERMCQNCDPFLPFETCLDGVVTPGEDAEILVGVRAESLFDDDSGRPGHRKVPAGSMWGHFISGIWQDVYLHALPQVSVEDVFIKPLVSRNILEIDVRVKNNGAGDRDISLKGDVCEWVNLAGSTVSEAPVPCWKLGDKALEVPSYKVRIPRGETTEVTLSVNVPEGSLRFWTPENPNLYALLLGLKSDGRDVDLKYERFGWREWTICGDKYCLNGSQYELRGDAWHFQGIAQMTRRYAWAWYRMLKDANCNAVRPHAQIYPRFYLDVADETGICVLDETGNWGSGANYMYNSPEYWANSEDQLRRFVLRDRNHASVFGWSISNENVNIIDACHGWDMLPNQETAWRQWRDIVQEYDGTRPWISADGEDDGSARFFSDAGVAEATGALPITMGHYGDIFQMRKWSGIGKPWGIGEQSMAYYGTPLDASEINGGRAYESMMGRMEALACQAYNLISLQRKMGVSYSSVFNIVWYALQPLPLGLKDAAGDIDISKDGIFFNHWCEGRPGVQPERLGPWCSTLNPGYDSNLPLYRPWPMFDAIRAANDPEGPVPSQWAESQITTFEPTDVVEPYQKIVYAGSPGSPLATLMQKAGIPVADVSEIRSEERILCISDASASLSEKNCKILRLASERGASIWLWGITPETLPSYTDFLPSSLELDTLRRSSFIPRQVSWMKGLNSSDFYFCEVQSGDACSYTMKGTLVDEGCVLLSACGTDWRRWNYQPESSKTVSLQRSELGCSAALPVFVKTSIGSSELYISTINDFTGTARGMQVFCRLLTNAGIPCANSGSFGIESVNPEDSSMSFQLTGRNSFRIFSRRDLRDLLMEPGIPRLSLSVQHGCSTVKVNGAPLEISADGLFHDIPLWLGWNDMELVVPADGTYQVKFICRDKPEYLEHLEISFK